MLKIRNETSNEHCGWCIDGWVELKGTVKAHGVTYSRGSAPCRWCETGLRRWNRMKELRQPVDDSYTEQDVERAESGPPVQRGEARRLIASLAGSMPRIPANESRAQIEQKRQQAQQALEESSRQEAGDGEAFDRAASSTLSDCRSEPAGTTELPPDPPPAEPPIDYDEIPF